MGILLKDFWKPLGNYRRGNSAFDIIPPTIQLTTSVGKCFKSETALFPAKNGQNPPPFFSSQKMTPMPFLSHFYVTIFPKTTHNYKKKLISIFPPRFFFQIAKAWNLPNPRNFSRHMRVLNCHFSANHVTFDRKFTQPVPTIVILEVPILPPPRFNQNLYLYLNYSTGSANTNCWF